MKPPICPPQDTPPVDHAPVSWITKMLFSKTWWLFFQGAARGLANLLNFPLYHDLVMFWPGVLSVTAFLPPNYPSPPNQRAGPWTFNAWVFGSPSGANIHIKVFRGAGSGDPGGLMGEFDILDGLPLPIAYTYYPDQNYTVPGSIVYIEVTSVGSVTPGSNLRIIARVEGVT